MKNIHFIGDLEGNIQALRDHIKEKDIADMIIQLGDFGVFGSLAALNKNPKYKEGSKQYYNCLKTIAELENGTFEAFPIPVYFIKGSNEDFSLIEGRASELEKYNLFFMKNGSTLEIGNIKIGFLGGIHSSVFFKKKSSDLRGRNRRFFTYDELLKFKDISLDILVTHKAMYGILPTKEEGSLELNILLDYTKPRTYIHAHHHIQYTKLSDDQPGASITGLGNFDKNRNAYTYNILVT